MPDTAVTTAIEMETNILTIDKQMSVKPTESDEPMHETTVIETSGRLQAMDSMEAREIALDSEVVAGMSQQPNLILQYSQHNPHLQACILPHV